MSIRSKLMSLKDIVESDYFFRVPIYQRLYVWGDDQVKTLLDDLYSAYSEQEKRGDYYLGCALVVKNERSSNSGACFDLIDGQQRFTTLWLISLIWRGELEKFLYRQKDGRKQPRISFSIRPEVDEYFLHRINDSENAGIQNAQIINAQANIESFRDEADKDVNFDPAGFSCFLYENVKLVLTRVPTHTDLNKLFEVINNRGLQLQHHEILKARLLRHIPAESGARDRYARLWEACAGMGDYVEKNLKDITRLRISDLFDNEAAKHDGEKLAKSSEVLEALSHLQSQESTDRDIGLGDILEDQVELAPADEDVSSDEVFQSDDVRSIISFSMLLQHTLRIWLHKKEQSDLPKILDRELLGLFNSHFFALDTSCEDVTSFIELLWEIRYLFDKHVIKWVNQDEEEQHLICRLYWQAKITRGKTYYSVVRRQPERNEGMALLQSMLYHSQQITTHYWLTPFLAFMHKNPGSRNNYFKYLRHLDNHLLCNEDEAPLVKRSRTFLEDPWKKNSLSCSILNEDLGVAFPHYWFYKLEFILWDQKRNEKNDSRWNDFRITAKNSVEHISPQNPEDTDGDKVTELSLNHFGNLALVSRSINSEYGNLPFNEKRQRFMNRNRLKLDSLKMAMIYQNEHWSDEYAKIHEQEMIELIEQYLNFQWGDA